MAGSTTRRPSFITGAILIGRTTTPEFGLGEGERPRIGFLLRCGNTLDPEVESSVVSAVRKAEELGMIVEPIELDLVSLEPAFLAFLRSMLLARLGGARCAHAGEA